MNCPLKHCGSNFNLCTKSCSAFSELLGNLKLLILQNVARNEQKVLEIQKSQKSFRASCEKPFIISINKTMTKQSKETKTKSISNGSKKSRFKLSLELFVPGRMFPSYLSDFTKLSIKLGEERTQGFKFWNDARFIRRARFCFYCDSSPFEQNSRFRELCNFFLRQ